MSRIKAATAPICGWDHLSAFIYPRDCGLKGLLPYPLPLHLCDPPHTPSHRLPGSLSRFACAFSQGPSLGEAKRCISPSELLPVHDPSLVCSLRLTPSRAGSQLWLLLSPGRRTRRKSLKCPCSSKNSWWAWDRGRTKPHLALKGRPTRHVPRNCFLPSLKNECTQAVHTCTHAPVLVGSNAP